MPPPRLRLVKGNKVKDVSQAPGDFEAALQRFLLARTAIGKRALSQYRRILNIYRDLSPEWPPTPEGVAAFIQYLGETYEPSTAYTYYAILRNFINYAFKRRLIADNPLDGVTPVRRPGLLPRAPLVENLKQLAAYLEKEVEKVISQRRKSYEYQGWHKVRNLALFSLMLDSGLRVSEVVSVRLSDVDLEGWTVFVRKGKGVKQREVPLGRITRADLKLWLSYRELIPIQADDPGHAHLFISHRRGWQPIDAAHVENVLEAACKKAGIPKITPHKLRHAFASLSHAGGAPIGRIQQWLGHTDTGTTMRYLLVKEGFEEHLKSSPRDHQV